MSEQVARARRGSTRSASSLRLAASAHCRSSRKSASGCSGLGERADELRGTPGATGSGLAERQLRHRRLRADDQLDLRDDVDDELPFGPERRLRAAAARPRCCSALSARMSSTSSRKAWTMREVGDVALVLLELARDEEAPLARRSAGAARAPATTCRCPSSRRRARAPACRVATTRSNASSSTARLGARGRRASAGSGSGRRRRARRARRRDRARSRATARRQRSRSCARPAALW